MKKIFTLMLALACAMFVGVSCTTDGPADNGGTTPPEPAYAVTLNVETPGVLPAEGGQVKLAYTLSQVVENATLAVSKDVEWILAPQVDAENGFVTFSCSSNPSVSNTRSAVVTVTYTNEAGENLAAPVAVSVSQNHGEPVFSVLWKDQTPKSAYAYIHSEDPTMRWFAFSMSVSGETAADEYFTSYLDGWKQGGMGAPAGIYKNLLQMKMQGGYAEGVGCDSNSMLYCVDEAYYPGETTYLCVVGITNVPENWIGMDMMDLYMGPEEDYMAFIETPDPTTFATPVHAFKLGTSPAPVVRVSSAVVDAPYTAYEQTLNVTVENPYGEDASVSVSEDAAAWLTATYENGQLKLTCEENPYAIDRKASVEVVYTYNVNITRFDSWSGESMTMPQEYTATATVEVTQAKNTSVKPFTLNVTVKETHFNGIVVDVVASDATTPYVLDATWEPRNGWESTYNSKLNSIGASDSPTTLLTGNQQGYHIKLSPNHLEYNGCDVVIYAFGVNETEKSMVSDPIQIPVTVDNSDYPELLIVEENGITREGPESNNYTLEAAPGTKVTVRFKVNKPAKGGLVVCTDTDDSDSYNVIDEDLPLVVDQETLSVTFTVSEYDTSNRYHHLSLHFSYTNAENDTWMINNTLKVTQTAPATPAE